jgi:ParB family chromosome partitioning protein
MSMTQRGLGKGLDALFRNSEASGAPERRHEISFVPPDALAPNAGQPRKHFDQEALEELAASIRSQGIVQPLLVRPAGNARYEIVAGERRWRAAKLAGLTKLPVLVRQLSDMEVTAAALIENLQREDLKPLEEAGAMAALREQFGLSQDELANTLGKSRSAVANALRLLNLSPEAQAHLERGDISAGHARALLSLEPPEACSELLRRILQRALNVRDAEYAAALFKDTGMFPWARDGAGNASATAGSGRPETTEHGTALSAVRTAKRKTCPPFVRDMQERLREKLKMRAGISGGETRGRISLHYESGEELRELLRRLGVDTGEPLPAETPPQ